MNETAYRYPALALPGRFSLALDKYPLDNEPFKNIIEKIDIALREGENTEALLMAKKAVLLYGAPGLILNYRVALKILEEDAAQAIEIQQQAYNELIFIMLAEKLLEVDKKAVFLILNDMPMEAIQKKDYWFRKKQKLIKLGRLEKLTEECEEVSKVILKECISAAV